MYSIPQQINNHFLSMDILFVNLVIIFMYVLNYIYIYVFTEPVDEVCKYIPVPTIVVRFTLCYFCSC